MHAIDTLIERPDDLTAEWLTAALGTTVTDFSYERIGTGQMSECYRVSLTYADGDTGPASVVLKVAAADPSSRHTGLAMGLYEREVRFYTDIAPGLNGPVAPCHHAAYDSSTGVFALLLGDASPAVVGDEIRGATRDQAATAMTQLGRVHGPLLGDPVLAETDWLNRASPVNQALIGALYAGYIDRYRDQVAPAHRDVCERLVESFDAYTAQEAEFGGPRGLIHGDFRLDNMLFGVDGAARPLTVVDWQTVSWGPAFTDVAYFIGCAMPVDRRREQYDELLQAYHDAIGGAASLDEIREGVRRQSFFGVLMAIVSPMLVERTERGDAMFMAMMERHAQHVLDTGALDVLPAAAAVEPLVPDAVDEGRHEPGSEQLWSESWYFDFVDAVQGIGGWIRLGIIPNEGHAWINALLCGPGMPTVAVLDWEAVVPESHERVVGRDVELGLETLHPLERYRVSLRGTGLAYDDPAGLLAETDGTPVEVTMDLTWTTVGTPYQYRLTTRYEIPCRVSGTVTVDDRSFEFNTVAGQRDHSWASRDWWSMEWVWSALHLDDGTHVHSLDLRVPGAPPMGVGYRQRAGEVVDLRSVVARETFGDDDLPIATELDLDGGDVVATFDVRGHAPVLLRATDGRLSRFPRAWGTVTTADGRTGVGWMEWNRNGG